MDILEELEKEHREVQQLLDTLAEGEVADRGDTFAKLKRSLTAHSRAEEKVVYDPTMEGNGEKARAGYVEHDLADYLMTKLARTRNKSTKEWLAGIKTLRTLVNTHIEQEEGELFAEVRDAFDEEKRKQMCEEFESIKKKFE